MWQRGDEGREIFGMPTGRKRRGVWHHRGRGMKFDLQRSRQRKYFLVVQGGGGRCVYVWRGEGYRRTGELK